MDTFEIINDLEKWDELVKESIYGTIFHSSDWLNTIRDISNKTLKIYGCFEDDKLIGGCSLYVDKLKFFKKAISRIGMTPYGGLVIEEFPGNNVKKREHRYNDIIESLLRVIDKERFDNIQIINSPGFIDIRPFTWNGWISKTLYAYHKKLDIDIEKNISKDVRWHIRKATKNNVTTKKLNDSSIFYELFSMTFERQGIKPPVTKNFLEKTIDLLVEKKIGEMWIAEIPSGEVISAEIILYDNKRAYSWAAASHTDFKNLGGTSLLLYDIFRDLAERGFKEINLMAGNTHKLTKFISGFNPALIPYYEVDKSRPLFKFFSSNYNNFR